MAKLDQIEIDDTLYEVVPEIGPLFSASTDYAAGDCVIKDAVLCRFKTDHAAGAWIGTDAEAIEVGKELTGLKQDYNNVPSSKVSVNIRGKKTHEGVVVYPSIYNLYDSFIAMLTQYDCYYYRDGNTRPYTYAVGFALCVPRKYIHRWAGGAIIMRNRASNDLITIETEGVTVQRSSALSNKDNQHGYLAVNMGFNDSDYDGTNKYTSLRAFIEIYTDETKTTVERTIYTNQVNFEYLSTSPFEMNVEATSIKQDGVISIGGIKYGDNKVMISPYPGYIDTPNTYISGFTEHHGSLSTLKEVYTIIPYSATYPYIEAILEYGLNNFIGSNPISISPPDTTVKSAVSSGSTFMLDDLWYKATTDLAVGDTLVVGTNCEAVDEPVIDTTQLKQELQDILDRLTALENA